MGGLSHEHFRLGDCNTALCAFYFIHKTCIHVKWWLKNYPAWSLNSELQSKAQLEYWQLCYALKWSVRDCRVTQTLLFPPSEHDNLINLCSSHSQQQDWGAVKLNDWVAITYNEWALMQRDINHHKPLLGSAVGLHRLAWTCLCGSELRIASQPFHAVTAVSSAWPLQLSLHPHCAPL